MKNKKRMQWFVALIIALALIVPAGIALPTQDAYASTTPESGSINFGKANLTDNVLTFPDATVSCAGKIFSCTVTVSKGYILTTGFSNADKYTNHKSATWLWDDGKTASEVQSFVRNLRFSYELAMDVQLSFDGSSGSNIPEGASITSFEHPDGTTHYYMFVYVAHTASKDIQWTEAYDAAKTYEYKGLQGYLATITSHQEDKILDAITDLSAWAGGARMLGNLEFKDLDKDTAELNQTSDTPTPIKNTDKTFKGMADSKWAWACGPEAGQMLRATRIASYVRTDPKGYSNWSTKDGVPNQPDSNGTNEWCLQVHYNSCTGEQGTCGWNDLPNDGAPTNAPLYGYFVEFSDYEEAHTENYVAGSGTFAGTFSTHKHEWTYDAYDGFLVANCHSNSEFTGDCKKKGIKTSLVIIDGTANTKTSVTLANYNEWRDVWDLPEITITYKSLTNPSTPVTTTLPTAQGEYKATASFTAGGGTYSISKNFTVYADKTIEAATGEPQGNHTHRWYYEVNEANGLVYVSCTGENNDKADCRGKRYQIEGVVAEDGTTYVSLTEQGKEDGECDFEELGFREPEILYIKLDDDWKTTSTTSRTEPGATGKYRMQLTFKNPDGTLAKGWTDYEIKKDDQGNIVPEEKYTYKYSGVGLDRSKGYLQFANEQNVGDDKDTAGNYNFVQFVEASEIGYDSTHENLRNYAHNSDGSLRSDIYIDMYTGKLVVPDGYVVNAYKTAANGKWTEIKGDKTFDTVLTGLLKKTMGGLTITNCYDHETKKAAESYYFSKITAPQSVQSMKANYEVCADDLGITNGQFIFSTTGVNPKALYNIGSTYEVSFAKIGEKNIVSWGWGVWPSSGGVWVPDSQITKDSKGNPAEKAVKYNFYVRTKATAHESDGAMIYTPASKEKKISVSSVTKAPKIKVTYNKKNGSLENRDIITFKKGTYGYFLGNLTEMPDPLKVKVEAEVVSDAALADEYDFGAFEGKKIDATAKAVKVDITEYVTETRNKIIIWTAAKVSKPASSKQVITLAQRKTITETSIPVVNNGIKLKVTQGETTTQYEIYDTAKKKWVTSVPACKVATEAAFTIRLKSNAKGGAESDEMTAAGVPAQLVITYGNVNTTGKEKIGVLKAEIIAIPKE